ncbi:MAG: preprotein translocase subunit SecE [Alphaproteobacteria bacterium]|nr:preprotein translocase subunit SecE [Alphaproteobacteria bacterium]
MANEQTVNDKPAAGLGQFVGETKREIAKVNWPTRKEIITTTTLIVVLALIAGLFFLLVDWGLGNVVEYILGIKS